MAHLPEDNDGFPTTRALSAELPLRDGEGSDARATQEIAELERLLQETQAERDVTQAKLTATLATLEETGKRLAKAMGQLQWLRKKVFGSSSEKLSEGDIKALFDSFARIYGRETAEDLFGKVGDREDGEKDEADEADESKGKPTEDGKRRRGRAGGRGRKKKKPRRKKVPKDLPRVRQEHELEEDERRCEDCGEPKQPIDSFSETKVLEFLLPMLYVFVHARRKYSCRTPECPGKERPPQTAPLPPQPIHKGKAGPGMLAHVVVSKYEDQQPLHRQAKIFRRHGTPIPESTLGGWVGASAALLDPLAQFLAQRVLASAILQTDDTVLPVRKEPHPKGHEKHGQRQPLRKSRLWGYRGDPENPYVFYDFTPTWAARDGPARVLADFEGDYLQADAYAGYEGILSKLPAERAGCLAHARRKFFDALDSDPERARLVLALIQCLYKVEGYAREQALGPEATKTLRQEHSKPLFALLKEWLDSVRDANVPPESKLGIAITYLTNQWEPLQRYLEDGRLSIDNNAMERHHRGIAMGRKTWLFAGSNEAGHWTAIFQTLIQSAKRNGLDPWLYLRHCLTRLPYLPRDETEREGFLAELLPDRCEFLKDKGSLAFLGPDLLMALGQSLAQLATPDGSEAPAE